MAFVLLSWHLNKYELNWIELNGIELICLSSLVCLCMWLLVALPLVCV
jgi:hypothetical protein